MLYGTELLMNAGPNGDHGRLRADSPVVSDRIDAFKGKG